jgi:D-arginine dehydrogenase
LRQEAGLTRKNAKVVIIGAGFAGAATAFGLVRRGVHDIVVLEQEEIPGYYASGRNAAMVRQFVSSPEVRRLARLGLSFYDSPPAPFPGPIGFRRVGSLLLASGKELAALRSWIEADGSEAPKVQFLSPKEVTAKIGVADPISHEAGIYTATDGVADIHALLNGFLAGARAGGSQILFKTRVIEFTVRGGRIAAVRTDKGDTIECDVVVNAAGPWAGRIGEIAGASPLPFRTYRRHLAQTGSVPGVDPAWPFVWDITHEVYFRPESGGVLLSPCDDGQIDPCDPPVDAATIEVLARKVAICFPGLRDAEMRRTWACIRTFVVDRQIAAGEDPRIRGFFWAAALGGNGVGLAPMLSELMPDLILGGRSGLLDDAGLRRISPSRFQL